MDIDRIMDDVERRGRELEADSRAMERKRISEARECEHQRTSSVTSDRMEREAEVVIAGMGPPVVVVITFAAFIVGKLITSFLMGF